MENHLVPADTFCVHHAIEFSFINALKDYGLVEITSIQEKTYIPEAALPTVEKMIHLHYDMDINFEGMQAIAHLLERLEESQKQQVALLNRLRFYGAEI